MKYKIFWCKVNKYYTDKWLNSDYLSWKSWVFVASCVVTDNAKKKRIKFVLKTLADLKEEDSKIYISWCGAFEDWKSQENFFELYKELSPYREKIEILWEDPDLENGDKTKDIKNKISNISSKLTWIYTKKFVLIQWWCDSFCTFCLTVKKRWRHFFRDKEDIRDDIIEFEKSWGKEVVLTWVNLSAWWLDSTNDIWKSKFSYLLDYLLKETNIERIRISSLWPEFIDDKCLEIFKEERIYPHFHFSLQSWSTNVLKSMSRHYDAKYIRELLEKTKDIKRKDLIDVSIWADIIVWFPWETDEDFLDTYNLVKDLKIQKLHAFPFSSHQKWESVPAWSFKNQIDDSVKKKRLEKLNFLWDEIREEFIKSQRWKKLKVLIESVKKDGDYISWKWWTQNYIEANNNNFKISSGIVTRNSIVEGELV